MFSNQDFAWIYKFLYDEQDKLKQVAKPFLVTQKLAVGIAYLNSC